MGASAYHDEYYQRNREKLIARRKAHYLAHRDEILAKQREYTINNADRIRASRARRMDAIRAQRREFMRSARGRFVSYKSDAKRRGIPFHLTREVFERLALQPCHYCGRSLLQMGLDRVINEVGYIDDNVVSCCGDCNRAKRKMTKMEFIDLCCRVSRRHGGSNEQPGRDMPGEC